MLFLYIHGFNSSPASYKAEATRLWLQQQQPAVRFLCPLLSNFAHQALDQLETAIASANGEAVLAGSSMGGYFATYLAEKYGLRAVLINPAVRPYLGLHQYLGENSNYHTGETWHMTEQHIEQYRTLDVETLQRPENLWCLLQKGYEVLDYRWAVEKYSVGKVTVEEGGDHSFQGYERYLPEIYKFLLGCGS